MSYRTVHMIMYTEVGDNGAGHYVNEDCGEGAGGHG